MVAQLKICAIAVSRDLIYKIYWNMECTRIVEDEDSEHKDTYPIPREENDRNWLYPLVEEAGGHRWNCFENRDFIAIDYMEDV